MQRVAAHALRLTTSTGPEQLAAHAAAGGAGAAGQHVTAFGDGRMTARQADGPGRHWRRQVNRSRTGTVPPPGLSHCSFEKG
jgi:hypothetical protein